MLFATTAATAGAVFTGERRFADKSRLRDLFIPARRARRLGQL
jgi:hypothetical protein